MIKKLSPLPEILVNKYKTWKSSYYLDNSEKFNKLAEEGQNPTTLVISCCDSRIHATSIFGAGEGEFFIHRNIANLVPHFSNSSEHLGTSATIEYATRELKIEHVIILGHTGCGGIKTAYNNYKKSNDKDYLFINKWLSILTPIFKNFSNESSIKNQIQKLEEESIKNSINNLFSFPNIKQDVENNRIQVHGLIHDIGSGDLKYLNPITEEFEKV